jgi:hypothetical protein
VGFDCLVNVLFEGVVIGDVKWLPHCLASCG